MVTKNLYEAYFYVFLLGSTFAGIAIIGLNYTLEYNLPPYYDQIVFFVMLWENVNCVLMTAWYQFVDRGWFLI